MAESLRHRLKRLRAELPTDRKRARALRTYLKRALARIAEVKRGITRTKKAIHEKQNPGLKAAGYLLQFEGQTESPAGSNDAPFLAKWRAGLPSLAWMKGQPWCGFACIAAWYYGAGVRLPDGVVYTPNIVNWVKTGQYFTLVRPENARAGDLVVFNFPGGSSVADHVGLARGPASGGVIPTIEGNTSSDDAGDQVNGGGVFARRRSTSLIAVVARPK